MLYIAFATDIQPIIVRKIVSFITESCSPEAYCHHKCPMGTGARSTVFREVPNRPNRDIVLTSDTWWMYV